jgi:sugar phosphate isomerase/epimerase
LGASGGKTSDPELGFFRAEHVDELDAVAEKLDRYGLSAIAAPVRTAEMSEEECVEFGDKAHALGIVISEVHFLRNLPAPDAQTRAARVEEARSLLRKADLMRARCLLGFAGSASPEDRISVPCAHNYTEAFVAELRELILRVLDGIELRYTKYGLEASPKTFFYRPEGCAALVDAVDHPDFGVHLDIMNMVSHDTYFHTTELIDRTFKLLGERIFAAHIKDISWDWDYQFLKFDERVVGDGVLDVPTYIGHIAKMDENFPCMCEHLEVEEDYVVSFERLHRIAADLGTSWIPRTQPATV